jgi:hypothetical protein
MRVVSFDHIQLGLFDGSAVPCAALCVKADAIAGGFCFFDGSAVPCTALCVKADTIAGGWLF